MRTHTNDFKTNIKLFGRELDSLLTYELDNEEIELGPEQLNSVSPNFESSILKSTMRCLKIDSNVEIPEGTIVNYKLGVKVADYRDNYDYVDYGNYIVKDVEKNEDTNSYTITCYDKMLYSMKDYEDLNIQYPTTIRSYIGALCTKIGLTFANSNDTFANYDRVISEELFLDSRGNKMGYTYRDVLDQLAGATASTICINEDDELEIRYITDTEDTINEEYFKNINVKFGQKYGPINSIVLSRSADSDNIFIRDDESVEQNGLCEIKIAENLFMNGNDRDEYLEDLLDYLDGTEYYINDFSSTGIGYYDVCDRYTASIDGTNYSCVMFNDEINVTQGLEENTHTDMPEESETDYTKADKTDRRINQAYLIVDKQNQEIEALTSRTEIVENTQQSEYEELLDKFDDYATLEDMTNITTQVTQLQTDTYTKTEIQQIANGTGVDGVKVTAVISTEATFDRDGMHYAKTDAPTNSTINEKGLKVNKSDGNTELLYAGFDDDSNSATYGNSIVRTDNLTVKTYLSCANGKGRIEQYTDSNNNTGVGFFLT